MGHDAADQRADTETKHQKARPRADRPWAVLIRPSLGDRSKRAGNYESRAEPLQRAGGDSRGPVRSNRDDERGNREQRGACGGGAARPKRVGRITMNIAEASK